MQITRALAVYFSVLIGLWSCNVTQPTEPPTDEASGASWTGATAATCGDGVCAPGVEDCGTCPGDCPCWQPGTICSSRQCVPVCGDNFCAPSLEDCGTCPVDCPCPDGTSCQNRQCVSAPPDPCEADPVCCGDICCRRPWKCGPFNEP